MPQDGTHWHPDRSSAGPLSLSMSQVPVLEWCVDKCELELSAKGLDMRVVCE